MQSLNYFKPMKNILLLISSIGILASTGCEMGSASNGLNNYQYFQIQGAISDQTATQSQARDVYVFLDNDTNLQNGYLKMIKISAMKEIAEFQFQNLLAGKYYLLAYKDNTGTAGPYGASVGSTVDPAGPTVVILSNSDLLVNVLLTGIY